MNEENIKKGTLFLTLFGNFFRIGLLTFGGGLSMLPVMHEAVVDKHQWLSDDDMVDIISISETTPGPIAVNTATFVGYRVAGFWGAFFATLGVVLPSFIIILAVSSVFRFFRDIKVVDYAFQGVRAGVLALVLRALFILAKKCPKTVFSYVLVAAAFVAISFIGVHAIWVLLAAILIGIVASLLIDKRKEKDAA